MQSSIGLISTCVFILISPILVWGAACDKNNTRSCDRLVSVSIFQVGPCGRAARCYWEQMHLEVHINNNLSDNATYEEKIKDLLCKIPTYGAYRAVTDEKERFKACGAEGGKSREFMYFPMPTQYTHTSTNGTKYYLKRMEECQIKEKECAKELQDKITDLCSKVSPNDLDKVTPNVTVRGKIAYKVFKTTTLPPTPKCSFQFKLMIRNPKLSGDTEPTEPEYEDQYVTPKHEPGGYMNRLRPPYYDLYVLYKIYRPPGLDPIWNETKAYQELAKYLPKDTIEHIHEAIHCVYDRVSSKDMEWKPEKFCWSSSTFICVDLRHIHQVNNDCALPRHGHEVETVPTTSTAAPPIN